VSNAAASIAAMQGNLVIIVPLRQKVSRAATFADRKRAYCVRALE